MSKTFEQALLNFGFFINLPKSDADILYSFARLLNILAHGYLDITFELIKTFINESPRIYENILDFLKNMDKY